MTAFYLHAFPVYHPMNYRRLGQTGLKVAPIGLGTDNFANPTPAAEAHDLLDRAVDAGINLVDTSNSYRARRKRTHHRAVDAADTTSG